MIIIEQKMQAGIKAGLSNNDLYGSLFFYVKETLTLFCEKLEKFQVEFHIECIDASVFATNMKDQGNINFTRKILIKFRNVL